MALPSIYDVTLADDATADEQAQALIQALRGQRGRGMLGLATGDKALASIGQQMVAGANAQEEQLGGAAGTRLQRALQRQQMAQQQGQHQDDLGLRRAQLAQAAQQNAQSLALQRERMAQEDALRRDQLSQDAFSAVADPVTGGIVMYNRKTGAIQPLGPGGGVPGPGIGAPQPGGPAPLPGIVGKPTEKQKNEVLDTSKNVAQLDLAIDALNKAPGSYGGAGNFLAGVTEQVGGTPVQSILSRRFNPEELQAKNYVSNVVSAIINQRAGANVTYREELRQKFLPQETDSLEAARLKLQNLRDFEIANYRAKGGPGDVAGSAEPAPQGQPRRRRWNPQTGSLE